METLGSIFFETREAKNISYQKVWDSIKLTEAQVKLIEGNKFPELGGYGIAKAIIFNYARYLELDSREIMNRFEDAWPSENSVKFHPKKPLTEKKIMLSTNFFWVIGISIFVVILTSILVFAYNRGYLKTPHFTSIFTSTNEQAVKDSEDVSLKPDTLRQKMLQLTNTPEVKKVVQNKQAAFSKTQKVVIDSVDYLGKHLGSSKVNPSLE